MDDTYDQDSDPGFTEQRQEEAYDRMAEFFQQYIDDHDGHIYMYEFAMWLYFLLWRMRQTLKPEEMYTYVGNCLGLVERALRLSREQGNDVIIAEDWRDMEGGLEMIQALSAAAKGDELTVPDNWEA